MTENLTMAILSMALTAVTAFLMGFVKGSQQCHDAYLSGSLYRDENATCRKAQVPLVHTTEGEAMGYALQPGNNRNSRALSGHPDF